MKKCFSYLKCLLVIVVPTVLLALPLSYCNNERCPDGDCFPDDVAKVDSVKLKADSLKIAKK